jgi:hypothetical protein
MLDPLDPSAVPPEVPPVPAPLSLPAAPVVSLELPVESTPELVLHASRGRRRTAVRNERYKE